MSGLNHGLLTAKDERRLGRLIRKGDQVARDELIEANLRLVVSIAKHFDRHGMEFDDLVSAGNIGLIRAAEKFRPGKRCRFSTYATWWIRREMHRAIQEGKFPVRCPMQQHQLLTKWGKVEDTLRYTLGRTPDLDEVADELEISENSRASVYSAKASRNFLSGTSELEEQTEDAEEGPTPQEAHELTGLLLERLSEREAEVIRLRFGLGIGDPMTLSEVGKRIGVSRERIRQIQQDAMEKMRG